MKEIAKPIMTVLLLMVTAFFLTSCVDDSDEYAHMVLRNRAWKVVESTNYYAYSPGDVFFFYGDGSFETRRYNGAPEYGYWNVRGSNLLMRFNNSQNSIDIEAPIPVLEGNYVVLNCYDYMYNTTYQIRLVSSYSLNGYGYNNWYNDGYYYTRKK